MLPTATRETTAATSRAAIVHRHKVATRPFLPAGLHTSTTDFVFRLKTSYQLMTTLSLAICRIFRHFFQLQGCDALCCQNNNAGRKRPALNRVLSPMIQALFLLLCSWRIQACNGKVLKTACLACWATLLNSSSNCRPVAVACNCG